MSEISADDNFKFRFVVSNPVLVSESYGLSHYEFAVDFATKNPAFTKNTGTIHRRYRDFEWLRERLIKEYEWSIVPPLPEKSLYGMIDKIKVQESLHEYRMRGLKRFLDRVGAHEHLSESKALQIFLETEDSEWKQKIFNSNDEKDNNISAGNNSSKNITETISTGAPKLFNSILKSSKEFFSSKSSSQQQQKNASISEVNTASKDNSYQQQPLEFNKESLNDPPFTEKLCKESIDYVNRLQKSFNVLKDKLLILVKRRQETSKSLNQFGDCFMKIREAEENFDSLSLSDPSTIFSTLSRFSNNNVSDVAIANEDNIYGQVKEGSNNASSLGNTLSNSLLAISNISNDLSNAYLELSKIEEKELVEMLIYYNLLCDSLKDTLKRLIGLIEKKVELEQRSLSYKNERDKMLNSKDSEKIKSIIQKIKEIDNELMAIKSRLEAFEFNFRKELHNFHLEKHCDFKDLMKTFADLQREYSETMENIWKKLQESLDNQE